MPTLTVISGPGSGQKVEVEGEIVIGRSDADLTIPDSEISRRHALVRPAERGVVVEDLGSTNGTLVDGRRIDEPVTLTMGAKIQVGDSVMELELAPDSPTRASGTPVAAPQATRVGARPTPQAAAAEPPAASQRPGAKGRRSGVVVGLGLLTLAVLAGIIAVLAFGGDDEDEVKATKRAFSGIATTALVTPPAQRLTVAGVVRGKPTGKMAAIIDRFVPSPPRPGGPTVPLDLKLALSQPDGSFNATFAGRLRLTPRAEEIVRGRARVTKGTGTYEGVKGSFNLSGDNPPGTQVSKFTLKGTLEY